MANPTLHYVNGSEFTIDNGNNLQVVRRFCVKDKLPVAPPLSDYFDWISAEVRSWVRNQVPTLATDYGTLHYNTIQLSESYYGQYYEFSVSYGRHEREVGTYQITVSGTGGTAHTIAGTRVAGFAVNAADIEDNGGLIGKQQDGSFAGVDIPIPSVQLTVTFRHGQGFLIPSYTQGVTAITGRPNASPWLGYAEEEVRFLGPEFSETGTEASATYHFNVERTKTNFQIGNITITEKKGQHILSPVMRYTEKGGHGVGEIKCIEVIKDVGGLTPVDYFSVFGWG